MGIDILGRPNGRYSLPDLHGIGTEVLQNSYSIFNSDSCYSYFSDIEAFEAWGACF